MAEMSLSKRMKATVRLIVLSIKRMFFQEILVLGDSHVRIFQSHEIHSGFRGSFFNVVSTPRATASGILNPISKVQAYPVFKKALTQSRAHQVIVIWYRAHKCGESVHVMLERALRSYSDFLAEIVRTPLLTIPDVAVCGDVAKARRDVTATQMECTELTLAFTRRISAACKTLGAIFVDLDSESLGAEGLVRRDLLNDDTADHHYSLSAHSRPIMPHLLRVLGSR